VLDVGRKTRTIPPAIRRALAARDTQCQFPGCTARRCDAHHLVHWADGGVTNLKNLLLLCRRHHRAMHEGGFSIHRGIDGVVAVLMPNGGRLDASPPTIGWRDAEPGYVHTDPLGPTTARLAAEGITIDHCTPTPCWDGTPFDVGWAIDVLRVTASPSTT